MTATSKKLLLGLIVSVFAASPNAWGAVTGLTAAPSAVTMYILNSNVSSIASAKTNSAPVVIASGSGTANISVSTSVSTPAGVQWLSAYLSSSTITVGTPQSVTISVNPAAFPTSPTVNSTFTGQVTVTTGSVSATITVTLKVVGGVDIQLTPQSQILSASPGGQSTTFSVGFNAGQPKGTPTSPGTSGFAFPVNLQSSTVDGASWLSASQTSNFGFGVTVSPGILSAGVYSGSVLITQGGGQTPFTGSFAVTVEVGSSSSSSGVDQSSLSFNLSAGAGPNQQTINVSAGSPTYFTTSASTANNGNWLQVSPSSASTPAPVTVTATPGTLAPGSYTGNVQITLGSQPINVPVTMTLTATAALQANLTTIALSSTQTNGACTPQAVQITSSDPTVTLGFNVQTPVTTPAFGAWLTSSPTSGQTPSTISISCNTSGLLPGNYNGTVTVKSAQATNTVNMPASLSASSSPSGGTTQTISHIADGGGWKSTTILVNSGSSPASYTLNLWNEAGATFSPPLATGSKTGSIPVGGSTTIQTADSDPNNLSEGWAEVTSSQSIGGTAIFRYDPTAQEAAVPLLASGGTQLIIPYETGNGLALGVALANPSTSQGATITEVVRDENGNQLSSRGLSLDAHTHKAFNPPSLTSVSGRGVIEYDSSTSIYGLGIRLAGSAFTSVDAVIPQAAATKTISHIADGGGWRSTIILVNTDTAPATYTVNFWNEAGAAYSPTLALGTNKGTIPVGGSVTIRTADLDPKNLTEGWAEIVSSQSIGGTAIFRLDTAGQEAAVPLLTAGGTKLAIPYEVGNGLALGVALANPSTTQDANITEIIRDENGNQVSTRNITLKAHNHVAFNPPGLNGLSGRGVVEYDSNVSVYGLGIRGANGAFTSVRAVYKQ